MTPQEAVAQLASILAARPKFTQDEIYDAMDEAGIPAPLADRAFKFTQIAWGRVFLDGLGVQFDPDYLCFDRDGEVIESGKLEENTYYAAALVLARRQPPVAGFTYLALMSSECNAVNSALNAGSQAKNLRMAPSALFIAMPTEQGMAKAREILKKLLTRRSEERG